MTALASAVAAAGDADLAAVGAALADPRRCRILLALDDGRALPASRLAAEAGVTPATASSHLRKLTEVGLLAVESHGRHRYYRLSGPAAGRLIEILGEFAPSRPVRSLREDTKAHALRRARTCYDHLAGKLGVALMTSFVHRGYLEGADGPIGAADIAADPPVGYGHEMDYRLTALGESFVDDFGVCFPPRRQTVRYCVDWTEQQHHLAGGLGRGLRDRLVQLGWVRPADQHRAVRVTQAGRAGLAEVLDIDVDVR